MKNKTLRIIILTIILVLFVQLTSFAALGKLTLKVKTNKDTYKVGEKVTVTIDWAKEVEAAGFVLKYDKSKLAFASTSLGSNFYNAETAGKILFNWAAFDGKAITKVVFEFTTKAEGSGKIFVENAKGFADKDLKQATGYEYESKTIKISNDAIIDKPDADDKENEVKPNKPSTDNNKNEVTPNKPSTDNNKNEIKPNNPTNDENKVQTDNPSIDAEKNEVIPNQPSVDNEITTDTDNKIEENNISKGKKKLTREEVKTILIVALIVDIGLIVLIFKKRK